MLVLKYVRGGPRSSRPRTSSGRTAGPTCSDRFKQLVDDAATTLEPEKHKVIFREINALLLSEGFTLAIVPGFVGFVNPGTCHGFAVNLNGFCVLERDLAKLAVGLLFLPFREGEHMTGGAPCPEASST